MHKYILAALAIVFCLLTQSCMTVNSNNYGDGAVYIGQDKPISTSTLPVQANGNTVPVSAVP